MPGCQRQRYFWREPHGRSGDYWEGWGYHWCPQLFLEERCCGEDGGEEILSSGFIQDFSERVDKWSHECRIIYMHQSGTTMHFQLSQTSRQSFAHLGLKGDGSSSMGGRESLPPTSPPALPPDRPPLFLLEDEEEEDGPPPPLG